MENKTFEELNTPCYILLPDELEEGIQLLFNSFKNNWENAIAGYSFKTNSLPYFINILKNKGFYAEVVSGDEYELALHMGFEKIIYNGPVKEKNTFFHALSNGHIINLDAKRELEWLEEFILEKGSDALKDTKIGLRVNFDLESMCPGETSSADAGSRFGFSYEEGGFKSALERLKELNVALSGLHLHASSKTRSVNIYRALANMAVKLKVEYDLDVSYVDIGGGFFGGMQGRPEFPDYVKAIREELIKAYSPEKTTLILEPGTSLASRSFDYVTGVVDVKDTKYGRFVTVDGSRTDVDPLHTKSGYLYEIISSDISKENEPSGDEKEDSPSQVICGYTCMENDRLMTLKDAKTLKAGDRIRIKKAGGYTMCLTPLFIRYFPDVYVCDNGTYKTVREHWGAVQYSAKSILEI